MNIRHTKKSPKKLNKPTLEKEIFEDSKTVSLNEEISENPSLQQEKRQGIKGIVKAVTEIAWKFLLLFLAAGKSLVFFRVPLVLTSAVTLDNFIHRFLDWLGTDEDTLKLLLILLRIALVVTFLISIRKEVSMISRTIKKEFKVEEQKIAVFLFMVFALIAYITLY